MVFCSGNGGNAFVGVLSEHTAPFRSSNASLSMMARALPRPNVQFMARVAMASPPTRRGFTSRYGQAEPIHRRVRFAEMRSNSGP